MSDCIETTYCRDRKGYGRRHHDGKLRGAHRVAYIEAHGLTHEDIDGLHVMHTCDNPPCINPEHLTLGTNQENIDDKVRKGRCAKRAKPRKYSDDLITQALTLRAGGMNLTEITRLTGIPGPYVSKLFRGKTGTGRQLPVQ
tara:strand:- start:528 stop:950 length:423 start_codon:yes stop_codon:yes gene_type:complete